MPDPRNVGLIIFDIGGTIVSSLEPVCESVKRAFSGLGWPVDFGELLDIFGRRLP